MFAEPRSAVFDGWRLGLRELSAIVQGDALSEILTASSPESDSNSAGGKISPEKIKYGQPCPLQLEKLEAWDERQDKRLHTSYGFVCLQTKYITQGVRRPHPGPLLFDAKGI